MSLKYGINSIGWYNFESLAQTLLRIVIGPGVTSFGGSRDGGRDAAFTGRAPFPSKQEKWSGFWVFQVKHIDFGQRGAQNARRALLRTFPGELQRLLSRRSRAPKEACDNYVLITNIPLTAGNRDSLAQSAKEVGFRGNFKALDGKEVCEFLDLHPQLRRAYPQLLALADLEVIVNRELYARSEAYLQNWQPKLTTFVRTSPYDKALSKLQSHCFVVLDGPPEAGKSTIAAALALCHATIGSEVVELRGSGDFYRMFAADRSQLFVADDAVGSVTFVPSLADDWSRDLPGILRKVDDRHLLIWTTRKYVLEEALAESRLGEAVHDFPGVHEVLVETGELSTLEKAAILYNHAKQANLSRKDRALIRERAEDIVCHPNFTPERIRQLFEVHSRALVR